jgi:hypothetical protein
MVVASIKTARSRKDMEVRNPKSTTPNRQAVRSRKYAQFPIQNPQSTMGWLLLFIRSPHVCAGNFP